VGRTHFTATRTLSGQAVGLPARGWHRSEDPRSSLVSFQPAAHVVMMLTTSWSRCRCDRGVGPTMRSPAIRAATPCDCCGVWPSQGFAMMSPSTTMTAPATDRGSPEAPSAKTRCPPTLWSSTGPLSDRCAGRGLGSCGGGWCLGVARSSARIATVEALPGDPARVPVDDVLADGELFATGVAGVAHSGMPSR
jgi:hypothetical protein